MARPWYPSVCILRTAQYHCTCIQNRSPSTSTEGFIAPGLELNIKVDSAAFVVSQMTFATQNIIIYTPWACIRKPASWSEYHHAPGFPSASLSALAPNVTAGGNTQWPSKLCPAIYPYRLLHVDWLAPADIFVSALILGDLEKDLQKDLRVFHGKFSKKTRVNRRRFTIHGYSTYLVVSVDYSQSGTCGRFSLWNNLFLLLFVMAQFPF